MRLDNILILFLDINILITGNLGIRVRLVLHEITRMNSF